MNRNDQNRRQIIQSLMGSSLILPAIVSDLLADACHEDSCPKSVQVI